MRRFPWRDSQYCLDGSPAPAPLEFEVERIARFDEVDALAIVWHGHYASYFEDARVALGEHFGIGYSTLKRELTPAPIKQLYVNYHLPLEFGERCRILVRLHWCEAARMNMSYQIINNRSEKVASGFTVQMFAQPGGGYLIEQPAFYAEFCQRWKQGQLTNGFTR
ncbi:acyl-CoA thioesterase [Erwinia sorbitola]|uniref:Acyl-CoA thioesterase n=1 Tax=Erwinia sorbitola TaxID=2681984 RepID=A0A6I6EK90_9GAMM|nr:acyl-CoA thioesterase [Erwinia sorbitola]MTD26909.1 acyl-CoA thioesterase [Erwinia sorbitola]QGU88475.1 acyl-CoA thioesterase [Erwinia sorbitola]